MTKELEQTSDENMFGDEKDPLFVPKVGDYSRSQGLALHEAH